VNKSDSDIRVDCKTLESPPFLQAYLHCLDL